VNLELFKNIGKSNARKRLKLNGHEVVLFIGRIEPLKGIDKLMKAIARLDNHKSKRLIILGGDEYSSKQVKELKRLARELAIEKSVIYNGSVKQEKLPLFYSCADVCVVPSYYETFGLVTLESLACGTPVVATDVGAAGSVIEDGRNGYLVKNNDPENLAEKIGRALSRIDENLKDKKSIRETVKHYSWSNIARDILKKYQRVVESYYSVLSL
jgi:D-inositol-3-phosphate glycosyltransferase